MGKVFHAFFADCANRRFLDTAQPVHRKLIASFPGDAFIAERQDNSLNVYLVSGEPIPFGVTGDAAIGRQPMTAARLQQINEASRRAAGSR